VLLGCQLFEPEVEDGLGLHTRIYGEISAASSTLSADVLASCILNVRCVQRSDVLRK
jgi:hypothetical protein